VHPQVCASDVDTIKTSPVASAYGHVVCFTIRASVDDKVKHGRIDKYDVVHRKVVRFLNTEKTGAVSLAVLVILVTVACLTSVRCGIRPTIM
jgi:hypothetical protein